MSPVIWAMYLIFWASFLHLPNEDNEKFSKGLVLRWNETMRVKIEIETAIFVKPKEFCETETAIEI